MKSRAALCLLATALLWPIALLAEETKRNVVFFLADDLGYMDIGANNPETFYETPHIDGLAARGVRFTQGYAACCVCSPTRASIMTGKYPPRVGITDFIGGRKSGRLLPAPNQNHLALEEVTIAERFRDAGYATFFAGKWHLGDGEYSPAAQGFDPSLTGKGVFFYPESKLPLPDPREDPKTTDRIANEACAFIDRHSRSPFFMFLPFQAVHTPIAASPALVEKYERKNGTAPPDAWGQEGERKVRLVQNHAVYAAMLEQMDSAIGRVVEALGRNGLTDNTVVVFMSDNGGLSTSEGHPTSNLPLRAGKGWPYEGGVRTPWIVVAPDVGRPGAVCDTPVISTDFYPAILDLTALTLDRDQHKDGVSFVPLLRGEKLERGAPLFWHYPHYGNQGGAPHGAVRDGDWKLIEWYENGRVELYNLRDDPGEKRNVAEQEQGIANRLRPRLERWRTEVNAVMPAPNPDFQGDGK